MEHPAKVFLHILIPALLTVAPAAASGQQPVDTFARQLAAFRYSLYPVLERMPDSLVMSTDFSGYDALNEKAARFLAGRDSVLGDYQRGILQAYTAGEEPSTEGYRPALHPEDADSLDGEMADLAGMLAFPIARIYFADPVELVRMIISAMNATQQPMEEYAAGLSRDRIAAPHIITIEEPDGRWRITVDNYRQIWTFRYDPTARRLALLAKYERNKP